MLDPSILTGFSLLVLEDDIFIATSLREILIQAGADAAEICVAVAQAEEAMAEMRFDAALLDIELSDGDTLSFAETLEGQGVKIIFHSGRPLPEHVKARLPQAAFVMKPCEPDLLLSIVASTLKK